jgi:glutaminase
MFEPLEIPEAEANAVVSTGHLPDPELVARLVREAYDRYRALDEGKVADYIPALGRVSRDLFGFTIVGVNGAVHEIGDAATLLHPERLQALRLRAGLPGDRGGGRRARRSA